MKRSSLIIVVLVLFWPLTVFGDQGSPWEIKLPFESATIKYEISGMENGSEITYIRNHGREVATYHTTKTNMMGMVMANETVEITNPDWVYSFDLTNSSGSKTVNPEKYMIEAYQRLSAAEKKQVLKNAEETGASMAKGFGGNVVKNAETILGYSCDKVEMMGTVSYSIHGAGIPLRVESNMMGISMKMEAVSLDEGKVDDKFFQLPAGIEPVMDPQSDAMARRMAAETMAMLKDPQSAARIRADAEEGRTQNAGQGQMGSEEQEQMKQAMEMLQEMFGGQKK